MTITLQASDSVEYFHDTDYELLGNLANYNVVSGCGLTESGSTMEVTIAAGAVTHNGSSVTVAGGNLTLVADGSNKRWSYATVDNTGAGVLVSGDAAASSSVEPTKPEVGDRVLLKMYKIEAGQTIASSIVVALDKRLIAVSASLPSTAQYFVESSGYKGFFALGAAAGDHGTIGSNSLMGLGFRSIQDSTSTLISGNGTTNQGAWNFSTGTTSGENVGVNGPRVTSSHDWTLVWRGIIGSAANQTCVIGAVTTASTPGADENGIIGFRVSGTGNIIGVCDSAGTETTRDSGATGAAECTLRIEVRSGGTIVRFYRNNAQIGADVTTNIPTGNLFISAGIVNSAAEDKDMYTYDLFGWREN